MNSKSINYSQKTQLYADIIERIEYVRTYRGLNKSKFSAAIGMKPQTYNNFIGAQGSKPNIELIYGIVFQYNVNPFWLLQGDGPVFSSEAALGEGQGSGVMAGGDSLMVREPALNDVRLTPESYRELRQKLDDLDPLLQDLEGRLREIEISQRPMMKSLVGLITRYLQMDPVNATKEIQNFVDRLRKKFGAD